MKQSLLGGDFLLERLYIGENPKIHQEWGELLELTGLTTDPPYTSVFGIYENEVLVATGARDDNRLKCVAIHPEHQKGTLFNELLSGLITEAHEQGIDRLFLYTKPGSADAFSHLGFRVLATTPDGVAFMERGTPNLFDYLDQLQESNRAYEAQHGKVGGPVESIVMNANPFTLGHRALIENALSRAKRLHLFILTEDASLIPTEVRERLVREGTADLPGIIYHPTDSYIISRASFPSYFLKKEKEGTKTQATLDAILYRDAIAPALGITNRTVGDEPFDLVTSIYNESLQEQFRGSITLSLMPRVSTPEGTVISASRVRAALMDGDMKTFRLLVPDSTYRFFSSSEGKKLIRSWRA